MLGGGPPDIGAADPASAEEGGAKDQDGEGLRRRLESDCSLRLPPAEGHCARCRQQMSKTQATTQTTGVQTEIAEVELRPRHEPEGLERYAEYFFLSFGAVGQFSG